MANVEIDRKLAENNKKNMIALSLLSLTTATVLLNTCKMTSPGFTDATIPLIADAVSLPILLYSTFWMRSLHRSRMRLYKQLHPDSDFFDNHPEY